jgi:hypothetical protein
VNLGLMMAGFQASGKTTFLAALYEWAQAGVDGGLRLRHEPEDREYFFDISQQWLQLEELARTDIAAPRNTELPLLDASGFAFDLQIPDVVGEHFGQAWERDDWPEEVSQITLSADGLLLFIRGFDLKPPLRLPPGESIGDHLHSEEEAADSDSPHKEWDAAEAPTQTILADLLEGIRDRRESMPIAVVISAWDRVLEEAEMTPDTWLRSNLPLLWQMLEGRSDEIPYRVFGISAQGGDLTQAEKHDELAQVRPPYKRIIVQEGETRTSDIGAPIIWLLEQSRGTA